MDLPPFLKDMISCPPQSGEGVHPWLYNVARNLHYHRSPEDIFDLLRASTDGCGRRVPDSEIMDAIENSKSFAWEPGSSSLPSRCTNPKWPKVDEEKRRGVIEEQSLALVDIWEASPIRLDESGPRTEDIIAELFPADCLLCCGASARKFATKGREEWRGGLANQSLIVPSPMSSKTGKTKDGRESQHTLDNTGPRRFLITEFDQGTTDEQAGLIGHLSKHAPLCLVVHSGGKSLHAWWWVDGEGGKDVVRFFRFAVGLGADPATWTRSQFVRMPYGTRDNGKTQTVYYYNPTPALPF